MESIALANHQQQKRANHSKLKTDCWFYGIYKKKYNQKAVNRYIYLKRVSRIIEVREAEEG